MEKGDTATDGDTQHTAEMSLEPDKRFFAAPSRAPRAENDVSSPVGTAYLLYEWLLEQETCRG